MANQSRNPAWTSGTMAKQSRASGNKANPSQTLPKGRRRSSMSATDWRCCPTWHVSASSLGNMAEQSPMVPKGRISSPRGRSSTTGRSSPWKSPFFLVLAAVSAFVVGPIRAATLLPCNQGYARDYRFCNGFCRECQCSNSRALKWCPSVPISSGCPSVVSMQYLTVPFQCCRSGCPSV